jgi:diguanylate cyclase (GGDEF)-like protein
MKRLIKDRYLSIQTKLVLPLVVTVAITLGVFLPITRNLINDSLEQEADRNLQALALSVTELVENSKTAVQNTALLVARQPDIMTAFHELNTASLQIQSVKEDLQVQEISIYTADFKQGDPAYFYGGPLITRRLQSNESVIHIREMLIMNTLRDRVAVSGIAIAPQGSQIIGAAPIFGTSADDLLGVVMVAIYMDEDYINTISKIAGADVAIVKDNAVIVSTIDTNSGYESLINQGWLRSASTPVTDIQYNDQDYRLLGYPLVVSDANQGSVLIAQPVKNLFAVTQSIQAILLALTGMSILTILWFWIASWLAFTRPLVQLMEATTRISQGKLDQKVSTGYLIYKDEITTLSENFNAMTKNLKDLYTSLEEKVKQRTRELTLAAITDDLTKAYNRRHFMDIASRELARARRHKLSLSIILLDADNFKEINDNYGHLYGDEVLKQISAICQGMMRSHDIFARYGGEEFIILLPETRIQSAHLVAERIRKTIENTRLKPDKIHTVSLGITALKKSDSELDQLLARADRALYDAKKGGKNCVKSA